MINIRPVSDLRNKYPEIEELVLKENEAVYLTKNGYGSMVVMSIDKYTQITDELKTNKLLKDKLDKAEIEELLEKSENELNNTSTKYLSEKDILKKAGETIKGNKKI